MEVHCKMAGTVIKLKSSPQSGGSSAPLDNTLEVAEPAYTFSNGILWLGQDDGGGLGGTTSVQIGGSYFTTKLDHNLGVLTASSALLVDSNSHIDKVIAGALQLTTSGGAGQIVSSIATTIDGTSSDTQLVTALAVKSFVQAETSSIELGEISNVTLGTLAAGNVLVYNSASGEWINRALSGDVTINASGVADISASGVSAGNYGSATAIPIFTVAADGRITSAGTANIATTLTITGDDAITQGIDLLTETLTLTGGTGLTTVTTSNRITVNLDDTAVTAGTYGSTAAIPQITIDAQGRITSATTLSVATVLDIAGDFGTDSVNLLDDTFTISGGTGLTTTATDNALTIVLDDTAVAAGSYGSATVIPVLTVDAQGRITGATTQTVSTNVTVAGDTGTGNIATGSTLTVAGGTALTSVFSAGTVTVTLDDTAVTAGAYGSATTIPQFTVDAQGRITAAGTVAINANSFGTVSVIDADSGFSWSDNGTTVSAANAATLTFVSGYGVNVDVDSASDAIRFNNTGVTSATAGTYITVDASTGDITIGTNATAANTVSTLVARDGSGDFAANKATLNELQVDNININGNVISSTVTNENIQISPNGTGIVEITAETNITGNVVIAGDFTVNGQTTTINVQQLVVEDPIIYLSSAAAGNAVDIGFVGNYNDGTYAHTGLVRHAADGVYYLFDGYTPDIDVDGNILDINHASLNIASLQANVVGALIGTAETATKLLTTRSISLTGDVVGTLTFDGSADVSMTATIQANSVALGTDTTGNYVATLASANGGLIVTGSGSETAGVTIELDVTDSLFVEGVQDAAGALFSNGTQSHISITYDDANNAINASVPVATTSVKGVASFSADNFAVTSGVVTITVIDGGTF